MTKLEAVNHVLTRLGLYRVSALETSAASLAGNVEAVIDQKAVSVQSENWNFNRRVDVTATPNGSQKLLLASIDTSGTIIELNPTGRDANRNISILNDRLFDLDENTEDFTAPMQVSYVLQLSWTSIPPKVRAYIAHEAAIAYNDGYGQRSRAPALVEEARRARARARGSDSNTYKSNILHKPEVTDMIGGPRTPFPGLPNR